MARPQHLPADLSPAQVVVLQDALLANSDRLLMAARAMFEIENVPLARSLAILGMEESGKAIALHKRRVRMAYEPEGERFVDKGLRDLWGQHGLKLEAVHRFLVDEEYWFDEGPPDPADNERVLGTIEEWKRDHNTLKQRGFYVDVTDEGDPVTPQETADAEAVKAVIGHVHQIGWQLRLGEHIEGKRRIEHEQDLPPASGEEIASMRALIRRIGPDIGERMIESMRRGKTGKKLNNTAYAFVPPENTFENVGRPGYEAQDRELLALTQEVSATVPESSDLKN